MHRDRPWRSCGADFLVDLRTEYSPEPDDFRGISLCAGYGGLDLGLHIAEPSYRTVAFVERDSHAAATLVARMADAALGQAPVWDDLRTFDARPFRGRIHIVSAGYPCQPFSYAGRRGGDADPRHLWPDVARIVGEARPEWVWCENVEGHLSLGCADVAGDLRRLGYRTKAGLFTAREVGARHRRRRLFLLAHADGVGRGVHAGPDHRERHGAGGEADRRRARERWAVLDVQRDEDLDRLVADAARDGVESGGGDVPLFAPGPGELHAWQRLLDEHPDTQPAILRAGDGLADRMERTRGAGNGVCSLAAACAWAVLKTAHRLDA
ncbi:DNA cytosine methyltransferase [Sphingomonas endophytica]|uniref:DNA cytosine methyltransferase n=1 Tax=Sphingomonas endophytica TaxID=869719 RepID=UPI003D15AF11